MALPPRDQRQQYLTRYTDANIIDFKERLGRIYGREIHHVQVFNFKGLTNLMAEGLIGMGLHTAEEIDSVHTGPRVRVNILYHLARYLRLFASGRKYKAMNSRGQFVVHLVEHFRLLAKERLQGLTVIIQDFPMIDMAELVDAAGAPEVAEGVPNANEGDQAVPAPQPPTVRPARTMAQWLGSLEEDVHGLGGELGDQREVFNSMACDFSRFTTWTVTRLSRMMDQARFTYTSYADF
uniref:Uncharacterized protein n=1 Tax=Tanacetum cinerariifolium TaxID=118510 RepID=A0A6L2K0R5_TANCI|nr:hypothetical protein [Tanacetum cinerariifolium]